MIRKTHSQRMAELAEKEAKRIHRHTRQQPVVRIDWRITASAKLYVEELALSKRQTAGRTLTQIIEFYKGQSS